MLAEAERTDTLRQQGSHVQLRVLLMALLCTCSIGLAGCAPTSKCQPPGLQVYLSKPLGIKFARGNDGGAYVSRSDPLLGNTDPRIEPGDKVVKVSASFGDDVWEAINFGQVGAQHGPVKRQPSSCRCYACCNCALLCIRPSQMGSCISNARIPERNGGQQTGVVGMTAWLGWKRVSAIAHVQIAPFLTLFRGRLFTPSKPAMAMCTCGSNATLVT